MRIGILTYHRVINEGSVLQAACLQRLLGARYPSAQVEVIDYRPTRREVTETLHVLNRRPPYLDWGHVPKMRQIRRFVRDELRTSSRRLTTNDAAGAMRFVAELEYDAVVVGSDTVWSDQTKVTKLSAPNAYFLPGLEGAHRIAFAASTDQSDRRRWRDRAHADRLRALIDRFDVITVRDGSTRADLVSLGLADQRILMMPDPTLLWDPKEFASLGTGTLGAVAPHAIIGIGEPALRSSVAEALRRRGIRPINLLGATVRGLVAPPPMTSLRERLGLYATAAIVVTDRFHGSIFALRLGSAPIIAVERAAVYPDRPSKVSDLFERLGLASAVWRHTRGPFDEAMIDRVQEMDEAFVAARTTRLSELAATAQPAFGAIDRLLTGTRNLEAMQRHVV